MGALLDKAYTAAGYLAGVFMVFILLAVLTAIFGRLLNFNAPGMDAYAGYSMAASSFLALAYTFRRGEHIRVTLLLQHVRPRANRALDVAAHVIAVGLAGGLAWFSARLVWQSHLFNDISTGLDATPLWLPQIGMALGALLLFVALVHQVVELLAGRHRPASSATSAEPHRIE